MHIQAFVGESPVCPSLLPSKNQPPHPADFPLRPRGLPKEPFMDRIPPTDRLHPLSWPQDPATLRASDARTESYEIRARSADFSAGYGTARATGWGYTVLAAPEWALGC